MLGYKSQSSLMEHLGESGRSLEGQNAGRNMNSTGLDCEVSQKTELTLENNIEAYPIII